MNIWTAQSNPTKQTLAAGFLTAMGGVLLFAFRHFSNINTKAGFLLGLFLLVLGVWGLLATGTQTITIDPKRRRITVADTTRFGTKERVIRFDEITHVGIGYLGKKSNFVEWYYLSLTLRDGKRYALFAPGRFYDGASNRANVEGWRDRLEGYLRG
ncbi:MAG: hypothetical protein CO066_06290 [Comamonadaceae bacterium CG_4_9_14_0_8_um_filter_60_18]|nr:MAG: hypothetical protein COW39_07590 [Comamonadaceae bacterium CG17_big_fil_post_rev_8_21_14_2_50_60_13]PJC14336.1 MAG: hypothetical protein CO066_06290 [Comamonadaceae bacterium CG_4_9_14_0_8_um_filter_60_18]